MTKTKFDLRVVTGKLKSLMLGNLGFPIILTVLLLILTAAKINGSSVGTYQSYFYPSQKDSHLLANNPEPVRSDEFLVNTQMTLAQSKAGYPEVNKNIGNGENMSLVLDVPYKGWSELFKPQNWSFFVLPMEYAFAFKWWFMAYLLVLSCYFFILSLLPGKRLFAAVMSLSLLFSGFVQWWYQYITLAPLYLSLATATAFTYFLKQNEKKNKILLSILLVYLLVSLALAFYPPFQIACGLVLAGYMIGALISYYKKSGKPLFIEALKWLIVCLVLAIIISGLYFISIIHILHTLNSTVYPGNRAISSGDFSITHLLSGDLGHQFISTTKAAAYRISGAPTNQSEASNFVLLTPFLFIPSIYLLYMEYKNKKKKETDWPLIVVNIVFVLFMLQLFVPEFNIFSRLFLFQKVPYQRDLIGLGLLNIIQLVLFMRNYLKNKMTFENKLIIGYAALVFLLEVLVGAIIHHDSPGFIGKKLVIIDSLVVPLVTYLLLKKRLLAAGLIFAIFSIYTSIQINPLYRGLAIVSNNPIDQEVQQIVKTSPNARWIGEGLLLESFPQLNGAHSLSGVYFYPQLNLWKKIDNGKNSYIYNRYAHADFQFTTSGNPKETDLQLIGADHFNITTNVCSNFLKESHVRYILTTNDLSSSCTSLVSQAVLPGGDFKVYKLTDY